MENTTHAGLTSAEAARRLKQYGPNLVATKKKLRPLVAFLRTFNSPLLWIILAASVVSIFVGERANAVILLSMVLLSVMLDYVNTARSEHAVEKLIARVVTTATVVRDGRAGETRLVDIVPGDVVVLSSGDVIPADGRLVEGKDFFVNQSALTGESLPVEKRGAPLAPSSGPRPDDPTALFMGTSVVTGFGTMIIERTGGQTEYGRIADRLLRAEPPTDFDRGIRRFSLFLMRVTFIMVGLVFLLNAAVNRGWLESFIFAIAIAIGLTPELLPVILTVSLSRGAVRMAKRHVIVKHLPAIENIGRMNILCTDKTGTLTENRISVARFIDGFGVSDESVLRLAYLSSVFHTGVVNPLDEAIKNFRPWDLSQTAKIDEIPFDFERRRESVVIEENGGRQLITKGAPEAILPICRRVRRQGDAVAIDQALDQQVERLFTDLSRHGYRVLAVASRPVEAQTVPYEPAQERDMTFLGFIALLDPPKDGVREAVRELGDLGVEIKILTGDSALLTEKICRDIGLPLRGVMTGEDVRRLSSAAWPAAVAQTTIFARIDPEQKEQIIAHLQRSGQVVGFLGDGINDAPALKGADVGISVNNAVDVAKETADIILLKHSLQVLRDGVLEGRRTFHNTLKYIMMVLSSNFGNMFSMTAASAFLPFLPMLPTQILLNNFLYDTSQLSLSTDRVDSRDLRRPTAWDLRFIRRFMLVFGPLSSLFDFLTFGLLLFVFRLPAGGFQAGWFIESVATQVLVVYVIRTKRSFFRSRPSLPLVLNTVAAVALAWAIPYLAIGRIFRLEPLSASIVLAMAGVVVIYLLLVELVKRWFFRRWQPDRPA